MFLKHNLLLLALKNVMPRKRGVLFVVKTGRIVNKNVFMIKKHASLFKPIRQTICIDLAPHTFHDVMK